MVQRTPNALAELYLADETAWMERTAELVRARRFDDIDPLSLAEFLTDMAKRDKREVVSRLVVMLAHLLKWQFQPKRRTRSWRSTIIEEQRELLGALDSRLLRNYANSVLGGAYQRARKEAAFDMGLAESKFPDECPWNVDELLTLHDELRG